MLDYITTHDLTDYINSSWDTSIKVPGPGIDCPSVRESYPKWLGEGYSGGDNG